MLALPTFGGVHTDWEILDPQPETFLTGAKNMSWIKNSYLDTLASLTLFADFMLNSSIF